MRAAPGCQPRWAARRSRPQCLAVGVALALGFAVAGWAILAPLLWLTLAAIGLAALARNKIGGQTGDVLGAAQQIGEIAALTAFASLI